MRLYRAVGKYPPKDSEYLTPAEQGRALPEDATEEQRRSFEALSAWSTVDGARKAARRRRSARCIAAYDIPDNCGVTYEESLESGHYDIRGDYEELKTYLAPETFDLEERR